MRQSDLRRGADISPCLQYRYTLTREWGVPGEPARWVCFVGLNPSIADADIDDPTIRREVGFARAIGATALVKVNMYAYRATCPDDLVAFVDTHGDFVARGPGNTIAVRSAVACARAYLGKGVFAAWGQMPRRLTASAYMIRLLGSPIMCLGTTKRGAPRHTLYLPKTACPQEWNGHG